MKVTDYIVQVLKKEGIKTVFGYTGGSIADLVDSIYKIDGIDFVQSYNEQAASFAANAYSEVTGGLGVAISSSGPGAINLINGIANAYFDSIPCLFITGNVHTLGEKPDTAVRQNAFQEADIVAMVTDITKYCVKIKSKDDIPYCIQTALNIAVEGRKGPVLIDIPYDIQRQEIEVNIKKEKIVQEFRQGSKSMVERFCNLLLQAKKPLILLGGGASESRSIINELVDQFGIPVVASMRGIDVYTGNNYCGFIGSYGNRYANLAIQYCDLLIIMGSRLDERQMGYTNNEFAPNAKIIRIDIDPIEINRKINTDLFVLCKCEEFIKELREIDIEYSCVRWRESLLAWKERYSFDVKSGRTMAASFLNWISEVVKDKTVYTVDVGQNQIAAAQSLILSKGDRFLSSSGLGCMGYALPAAIGAYYANPGMKICSINGDGGMQMNIQELQTISREKIPIKIIIMNNHSLGLIRNLQDKLFNKRYYASVEGYSAPDFGKIAFAYNIDYIKIEKMGNCEIIKSYLFSERSCIIDVQIPINQNVYPEAGEKINLQLPHLSKDEMQQIELDIKKLE